MSAERGESAEDARPRGRGRGRKPSGYLLVLKFVDDSELERRPLRRAQLTDAKSQGAGLRRGVDAAIGLLIGISGR
jgi:hypothetical protein